MHAIDYALIATMAVYWLSVIAVVVTLATMALRVARGKVVRSLLRRFAVAYALAGAAMGLTFKLATPAMVWWGISYFVLLWPVWQLQDITGLHPPIPEWMFNFEGF